MIRTVFPILMKSKEGWLRYLTLKRLILSLNLLNIRPSPASVTAASFFLGALTQTMKS